MDNMINGRSINLIIIFAGIASCVSICLLLSGCINPSPNASPVPPGPPAASGHVYLDGNAISGAKVEAIAINDTSNVVFSITDGNGAYSLNITPYTVYNVTATYQGLMHTIKPVYLKDTSDIFNITLTTIPKSTIEGVGHPITHPELFKGNCYINLRSTKDNTIISQAMNDDGSYTVEVEPNIPYDLNGTLGLRGQVPTGEFKYHNYPTLLGNHPQIMVGSNETVLIDIGFVIP